MVIKMVYRKREGIQRGWLGNRETTESGKLSNAINAFKLEAAATALPSSTGFSEKTNTYQAHMFESTSQFIAIEAARHNTYR